MKKKEKFFWQTAYTLCALFLIGAVVGWLYECVVRSISEKSWVNAGMLYGPYLPIYGLGLAVLYGLACIPLPIKNRLLKGVVQLLLSGVILTLLEYIGGLIFIRGFGLQLWNYEQFPYNLQGIICPVCSLGWAIAGGVYMWFLHPQVLRLRAVILQAEIVRFLLAFGIGAVFADFILSLFL